jgi:hypothetical protein
LKVNENNNDNEVDIEEDEDEEDFLTGRYYEEFKDVF